MATKNSFHSLPPSKRYKLLLHQEEGFQNPSLQPPSTILTVKKRPDHYHEHYLVDSQTTCCLPAKKRVWALPPIVSFGCQEEEADEPKKEELRVGFLHSMEEKPIRQEGMEKDLEEEEEEGEEDGVFCAVCKSTDGDEQDPIVFCDGCGLMVHTTCYGNPLIESVSEGDWFCRACQGRKKRKKKQQEEEEAFECCLCPVMGGAMKETTDGRWAHILCAVFVPEVFFRDPVGRDAVDLSRVPAWRWKGACYLCGSGGGCVIQCSEPKCGLEFHVYCGLEKEVCLEYREGKGGGVVVGFCEEHTQLWKKQQMTGKFKIVPREEQQRRKKKKKN